MYLLDKHGNALFEESTHYKVMRVLLLGWWIGFVFRAFDVRSVAGNLSQAGAATEEGSMANQVLVFLLAAMGAYHLPRAWYVLQSKEGRNVVLLLLAYLSWAASSLLWSYDPPLSLRRFAALVLLTIGCVGLGAGFYSRTAGGVMTLARHVFIGGLIAVAILLPPQLRQFSLSDILNPKFNVKDSINIASITYPIGYACLAGIAIFHARERLRWIVLMVSVVLMFFMKGRSMLGDVVASSMLLSSTIEVRRGWRHLLAVLGAAQAAVLADLATGGRLFIGYILGAYDNLGAVLPWLSNGEGLKNLTSLSGRVPLWNALYAYVAENPMLGYGFGAFWNPMHLEQVYTLAGWRAVVAHNGFLDELLATGIIGLTLFLMLVLYAMLLGIRASRQNDTCAGYLVSGWLLIFLLFNTMDSIMQTYFQLPVFVSITGVATMMQLYSAEAPDWAAEGIPINRPFMLRKVGL